MTRSLNPVLAVASALALTAALAACGPSRSTVADAPAPTDERVLQDFGDFSQDLMMRLLARSPEWSIYSGRYDDAGTLTVPDAVQRQDELAFVDASLAALAAYDPDALTPDQRIDHMLLVNRLESTRWYQTQFLGWQWNPSNYNVAGPIGLLLNTPYAAEEERLRTVMARLRQVPAYYEAAWANIQDPTLEHTRLAITQNRGALGLLDESLRERAEASALDPSEVGELEGVRIAAVAAIEGFIGRLEQLAAGLESRDDVRSFRIGAELYEPKFRYDIQSGFSASELHQRALAEKDRLHGDMDAIAVQLWPKYFPRTALPDDRLERIGALIDHLSNRHVARGEFINEIKRQIPLLAAFVDQHGLVEQDPSRPLVVRETPEYMRGGGAGASVSAPGPFNPTADTYYNVTPLDAYSEEEAASYLREYNHWVLQILNIHEAIPGHYTQLLHANKSPSLIKSLLRNGAMIEGWAVYSERMMLEAGWGEDAPEMWLMYGKWNLRVVTNAILDYAVHVEGMERDAALDLLMREAFQERTEAENKWRRVTLSQVQLTSYFTGYAEIYDFRERLKAEQGEGFDLREFHDRFLGFGNAPVPAIIELMAD